MTAASFVRSLAPHRSISFPRRYEACKRNTASCLATFAALRRSTALSLAVDFFANFAKKMGLRILETPWKFEGKSDPRWEYLDHDKMDRAKSYTLGEGRGRKKTAGPILSSKGFDKYKEWKPFVIACDTTCDVCPNQCGTVDQQKGADIRYMIQNGESIGKN